MVKYDANWENVNTYKNLQIVRSQFFTDEVADGVFVHGKPF